MALLSYPIEYTEEDASLVRGTLLLEDAVSYPLNSRGSGFYRPGKIKLEGGAELDLALYHNDATAKFIYLRDERTDADLLKLIWLEQGEIAKIKSLRLPGQLCLGSERTRLIGRAIQGVLGAPNIRTSIARQRQENIAIFPIAREGLKYQVAEALFENHGFYCDEIVLEAHQDSRLYVTFTVAGELAAGVSLAARARWEEFLGPFHILPFTADVSWEYGRAYRFLRENGLLIGTNDLWIAATGLAYRVPVVTRNVEHYRRVPDLEVLAYRP